MDAKRREVARLCRAAVDRPRWQLVFGVLVSAWALAWILAQLRHQQHSPLGVLRGAVSWAGIPAGWLDDSTDWLRDPRRHGLWAWLAIAAGLLWAGTSERAQLPALLGWLAVLTAGEGIGYAAAVHRAALTMLVFVAALVVLSVLRRRHLVLRRTVLIPRDVLRAGVTAAALTAVVPLLAPGLALAGLVRPYVTRPPRPDPTRAVIPLARREDEYVPRHADHARP
ncbi:hypothetical protein F0L68_07800 [Solihabitans fulvus]|uniref:Uncharacterized protein n=1 Tax=Solihabitans fulvus TaxID=1892852 RepID=A0A5B2XMD9_9PSEU|nr:hypothetical protein [Solihabitans fulvus]KAA2264315.1 hypothetical protein F0L68_07800 [Solihabitans fulvus]